MRVLYSLLLFHMLALGEYLHFTELFPWIFFRHGNTVKQQVCYDEVGCFPTSPPWNRTVYRKNNSFFTTKEVPSPRSPKSLNTSIVLYTSETKENATPFYAHGSCNIPRDFNPQLKIYVIVHGYDGNIRSPFLQLLKNNLLEEDVNVLMVTWGTLSGPDNYAQSVSDTRVVGVVLARFIVQLREHLRDDLYFHLIGHSLGAHICGYAGKELKRRGCQPVQRITGTDPAGIGFMKLPAEARLCPYDAFFVDIIHTDRYMLGIDESLGDVDFVINGGHDMPECLDPKSAEINKTKAAQEMNVCSHIMAVNYLAYALTARGCQYWGVQAIKDPCESGDSKVLNVESLPKACEMDACSALDGPEHFPALGRVDVDTRRNCSPSEMRFLEEYKQSRQGKMWPVTKKCGPYQEVQLQRCSWKEK